MFHLSLPVTSLEKCLKFYRDCFDARIVMLSGRAANLFVFGGQLTLHDRPDSSFVEAQRREMHFGQVVSDNDWHALKARIEALGYPILYCADPSIEDRTRGKLLITDPSGNIVEINSSHIATG